MDLKNVKKIQIPDSRYRQLEYLHFSGAEYINTNKTLTGPNTYKRATMKVSFKDVNRWSYCGYIGNNSNFVFGTRPTNLATFSLGAVSYGTNAYELSTNVIYNYDLWVDSANNNNLTVSDESGTALWTSSALSTTWSADTGNLYIGACYDARSSGPSGYMVADIYNFIVRNSSYNNIIFQGIPCQRKSDGVCGMFDIISKTFIPMQGTNITDAAAGTITQENMLFNVDKIEDSNNNIIWGSLDAFPYRRLEYIHFNGTDNYLLAPISSKPGYYRSYQFDIERNNVIQESLGIYDGTKSNNDQRRFYVLNLTGTNATGGIRACVGNTWSSSVAITNIPLNTKLRCSLVSSIVNSKNRLVFNLVRLDTTTNIIGNTTIDSNNATLTDKQPYLMGRRAVSSSGNSLELPTKGKVYYFEERQTNWQGVLTHQCYPVQRKSDGLCGLYDIITNSFIDIKGTQDSSNAGPTVDEYWDLQA